LDIFKDFLLKELGGWPLINQSFNPNKNPMEQLLAFFKNGVSPIFEGESLYIFILIIYIFS
jgi:hypothetical protein